MARCKPECTQTKFSPFFRGCIFSGFGYCMHYTNWWERKLKEAFFFGIAQIIEMINANDAIRCHRKWASIVTESTDSLCICDTYARASCDHSGYILVCAAKIVLVLGQLKLALVYVESISYCFTYSRLNDHSLRCSDINVAPSAGIPLFPY